MTANNGTARRGAVGMLVDRPLLLAALGAVIISTSAVLVVLANASAASTAFFRTGLALPVLLVLAFLEQRRSGRRPLAQRLRAGLAGLFLAVDLVVWTHAIADIGAGVATVLGNLQVLFVAGIAWLVWHERPHRSVLAAIPVVMAGVVLVSGLLGGHGTAAHPIAGVIYGVSTGVSYAAFIITLRRSSTGSPHVAGPMADATAGAAVAALAYGLVFGGLTLHPVWPAFGWLLTLALVSQVIGWLAITSSLPRLPASVGSLMLLLQPAASLALAAIILNQLPTLLQILGAVLICGGALGASVAAARTADRRPAATDPAATGDPAPSDPAAVTGSGSQSSG
jgi:drug/metabolite transporter (DMT)-like permease